MGTLLKIGTENISNVYHVSDETELVLVKNRICVIIGGQCCPSTILESLSNAAKKTALLALILARRPKAV
jgi:hypothetical protein